MTSHVSFNLRYHRIFRGDRMNYRKSFWIGCLSALGMLVLILDAKTAMNGGAEGISLCIQTLIPSLFPFFLLSDLLISSVAGYTGKWIRPLEKLLRIPSGTGGIILVGLLGGYPLGAQGIAQAQKSGMLSQTDARRMMAFCNNAGPSFLFGISAILFPEIWMCWTLWGIHILSVILVGILTPGASHSQTTPTRRKFSSLPQTLKKAITGMAMVCGWVILFRILLAFCQRWFLWLLPETVQYFLSGILEIANGCCSLPQLGSVGLRFTLCAVFLGFGGLCVALQTYCVSLDVDIRLYLPGKIAQASISYLLSIPIQFLLPADHRADIFFPGIVTALVILLIFVLLARKMQKTVAFPRCIVYNRWKDRGNMYAVSEKNGKAL